MTALCSGGTSSAKPGFGASLFMGPSAIAALLNNIPTVWAVPLAAYIGYVTYNLSSFCSNDPPAVPTITAVDVINLLNPGDPFTSNSAGQKFNDLIGAYVWHQVCQCDSVATPAPPAPPSAPTGMPSINPPAVAPAYPSGTACQQWQWNFDSTSNPFVQGPLVPIGEITHFEVDLDATADHTDAGQWGFNVRYYNSSRTQILPSLVAGYTTTPTATHQHAAGDIPSGTAFYSFAWGASLGTPTNLFPIRTVVNAYCGTTPGGGGGVPTPCPPDPVVQGLLDQILSLVTLIQRQSSPFAYVGGGTHPVSGQGEFDVQGLIGVKVTIDTFPSGVGVESGDPDVLWQAGWFNWGNDDGFRDRIWISASPQVSFPAAAGQFTRIGYSLSPGVSATFTELSREP